MTYALKSSLAALAASAVPEPGTVMLVLAGLVMMVYMNRRLRHGNR
jgi:PEP-CTERM motif